MKRVFVLVSVLASLFAWPAPAQETTNASAPTDTPAAAVAAREGADERNERMTADIQALQTANEALQAKITALEAAIQELRNQLVQVAANSNVQDDLKRLAAKIEEVDTKREQDKETISELIRRSIADLEKGARTSTPAHEPSSKPVTNTAAPAPENCVVYAVKDGQTLSAIVKAYNEEYESKGLKRISWKQVEDANPGVDWNRLRIGQKINVPLPESK